MSPLGPQPPENPPDTPPADSPELFASPRRMGEAPGTRRYDRRFRAIYAALGVVAVAAVGTFVALVANPSHHTSVPWSVWKPASGSTTAMSAEIAQHVAHKYRTNAGGSQLVAIIPSKPTVTSGTTNIAIKAIAIRGATNSPNGIEVLGSNKTEMFNFCGLGLHCSIVGGKATTMRGRLVRREALELALYTFKYVPGIDSIIAFMPPAPGKNASAVLFLQKSDFKNALSRPLVETLKLAEPPLPTQPDTAEGTTIDALTLPSLFSYELQALQTGGAALVLDHTS
jgi:hypothetical protein